jgi:PAS domain S-box-containing protein
MGSEARDSTDSKTYFDSSVWRQARTPAQGIAEAVALGLKVDEVYVSLASEQPNYGYARYPVDRRILSSQRALPAHTFELFSLKNGRVTFKDIQLQLPIVANDVTKTRLPAALSTALAGRGIRSFGLFPIRKQGEVVGIVACAFKRSPHKWRNDEIRAFDTLHQALPTSSKQVTTIRRPESSHILQSRIGQYNRLAQQGSLLIVTTDSSFRITDIFGNTEALLGLPAKSITGDQTIWERVVPADDLQALRRRIQRSRTERKELQCEMRIIHQETGRQNWLLLRALPQFTPTGEFIGWEGFGVDVTERRVTEKAFADQNRRLEALFEVARTLQGFHDPAAATFTGLRAVLRATEGDCGYACFVDRDTGELEVVAAVGLSERYLAQIGAILKGPSLLREAVDSQAGLLVEDLLTHPRAQKPLAEMEGVRGTIIVPMIAEGVVTGALVLFTREPAGFTDDDFDLAAAAVSQLTLAVRRAELLEEQRQQSDSLSSLYKVSRELAKYRGSADFAEAVLPILKSAFAIKRGWIGLVNDQGTFLVGQAGFGPGFSRATIGTQIQVLPEYTTLHTVVTNQKHLYLRGVAQQPREPLLDLFDGSDTLMVVPMVTIGRVLGVLAIEPVAAHLFPSRERERLLTTIANEMATALIAGRFESKMAEALKMRMAGLLASGVAHNFNNLLQAILGQVSLIDMKSPNGSPIRSATKTISDAAQRGASLVGQLLNFASKGGGRKVPATISKLISDSRDVYASLVGSQVTLRIDEQQGDDVQVAVDPNQFQGVLSNILANAKEAIGTSADGEVSISVHSAVVRSGELGPEVSPGTYVRIDIEDNGRGMSPEQQERCFEPFFTTKNIDIATGVGLTGAGLGLAAAYSIIKDHDGIITVHSKPGDGSVFSIYLPTLPPRNTSAIASANSDQPRFWTGKGVLLLGVDAGVQPFLSKTLESLGHTSRGVFDSRQAHELLRKEPERWGIVLLDAEGLGGRCGVMCEELAGSHPWINVLCVCSAEHSGGELEEQHTNPRVHHLEKPITVWGLESALQRFRPVKSDDT